jgi:hypothetical protein
VKLPLAVNLVSGRGHIGAVPGVEILDAERMVVAKVHEPNGDFREDYLDARDRASVIVHAVNAHDALVDALQGIVDDDASQTSLADQRARWHDRMAVARAALAKAKGGVA